MVPRYTFRIKIITLGALLVQVGFWIHLGTAVPAICDIMDALAMARVNPCSRIIVPQRQQQEKTQAVMKISSSPEQSISRAYRALTVMVPPMQGPGPLRKVIGSQISKWGA